MTQRLYDFNCKHCGNIFDEFMESHDVEVKRDLGEAITYECPKCGETADYVPIGAAAHGYHRTSWKV